MNTGYKFWSVCIILSACFVVSHAQSILTNDNFETYTAGVRLCAQAPAYWFTWNHGPGTAEDPLVTDSLAFEGSKSLQVTGANDVLLNLNGKTSGRYEISFYARIPSGKTGFFGLLHLFAGNSSEWAMQCFLDTGNKGTIEAGGNSVDFSYFNDQWIRFRSVADLDNDHGEMYVNGTLAFEWQWSKGMDGNPGILKLDALNFFAWNADQRQPFMFVDSVLFESMPVAEPPVNLSATVNGSTVNLAWEAPSSGVPLGYKVYRDTTIIAPLVTALSFADPDVYPGTYTYSVKAVYASGMSKPAGPVQATVDGGTPRKFVLLEIATGTWCTYCPGASMGADDLISYGKNVAVIEYHNNDEFANPDADARNNYYSIPGYPTAHFDGLTEYAGGNMTQSMYPVYLPMYNHCIPKRSLFTLEMDVVKTGSMELEVTLTGKKIYAYAGNNLKLHLVLTETHIPKTWQTIMHEVNFVCRKMYPDYHGTSADFSGDSTVTAHYSVSLDSSYIHNNCSLVAFIQDNSTKEILQSDMVNLGTLGTEDKEAIRVSVYPNPTNDLLYIKGDLILRSVTVADVSGRVVLTAEPGKKESVLKVSSLKPGSYFLYLLTSKGTTVRKFIITP